MSKKVKGPESGEKQRIINGFARRSLSSRLRNVLIGIVLLMIIAFMVSISWITRKERIDHEIREAQTRLNSLANGIQANIEGYLELSRLIMVDRDVVNYLNTQSVLVNEGLVNDARYAVLAILNVTENVDSVFIFRNDEKYMATNRGAYKLDYDRMKEPEWKERLMAGKGKAFVSINGDHALFKTNGQDVVTLGRAIYDLNSQKNTGIMLINVSTLMLEKKIGLLPNGIVCIVGTDGTFLAGDESLYPYMSEEFESEEVVNKLVDAKDRKMMISGRRVSGTPIVLLYTTNTEEMVFPYETGYVLLFLLFIFVVGVIFVATFVTRNITHPISILTSGMEKNKESGKLEKISESMPHNELGMLEDSYNSMVERVNDLFNRLIENEKTIQKAEMRVLHEQIKPHFLYNSLETIGFLAMEAGAEEVHSALETLGSFYRNFLSKGDREIPLRREIQIIQDYLSLQKLRYGDIIEDEYDIPEDTKDCIIPKLILQPLVENSIYHGIRLKGEKGTISISSRLEKHVLHIMVRDTGVGMSQEQIDRMLSKKQSSDAGISGDPSESFGLWGTIERIRCFCDNDDVVRIRSEEGEYTEVEFLIPAHKPGDGREAERLREEMDTQNVSTLVKSAQKEGIKGTDEKRTASNCPKRRRRRKRSGTL